MSKPVAHTQRQYKPKKRHKALTRLLIFLFIIALTFVCAYFSYDYVIKNYVDDSKKAPVVVNPQDGVEFTIERGARTDRIAEDLKAQGFIKNSSIYKILSKINGYDGLYQSGTHVLSKSLSYDEVMRILTSKPASKQVTIPEGKSFMQIVDILYNNKIIKDKEAFIKTANTGNFDYPFLKDLPPRDNRLEGYLFPDTYEFALNASDQDIIKKMLDNFSSKFKPQYTEQIKNLKNMTEDKVIILASIIEREAKIPEERYTISGVFYNRLNSKDKTLRKLQSCATIQYILLKTTGAIKERLFDADLKINDPYNTYMYEGLPPGPICCPGDAAIKAALYPPDDRPYLYFVATGDAEGTHVFSKTYKEHQAAISKYGLR